VFHKSDTTRLPEGPVILKTFRKYSYEQVSEIVEHQHQVIRYKLPGGKICDGEPETIDVVPDTHASGSFLAYLAFNKYVLDIPLYRHFHLSYAEEICIVFFQGLL